MLAEDLHKSFFPLVLRGVETGVETVELCSGSGDAVSVGRVTEVAVIAASCSLYLCNSCALRSLNSFSSTRSSSKRFRASCKATLSFSLSRLSASLVMVR